MDALLWVGFTSDECQAPFGSVHNDGEIIWHGDVNGKVRMVMCQSAQGLELWRCLPVAGRDRAVRFCDQCL